jgi:hypothetical protein
MGMRQPGPKQLAKEFAQGNWTSMLAKKYGMYEATVEVKLMNYVRSTLPKKKKDQSK